MLVHVVDHVVDHIFDHEEETHTTSHKKIEQNQYSESIVI